MAQPAVSAAEAALENQRIGGLQIRVAVLCTLVQICDGYDINSVAWAVPSLIRAWHLPPAMFTTAFLWSSIGILVGALSAGSDRRPFRPPAAVACQSHHLRRGVAAERGRRFGRHAGAMALFHRRRHRRRLFRSGRIDRRLRSAPPAARLMIMVTFTGAPLGGFVGGQIVGMLLPHFGWPGDLRPGRRRSPIAGARHWRCGCRNRRGSWLPKRNLSPRQAALLQRLDIAPTQRRRPSTSPQGNPIVMLFGRAMPCRPYCCGSSSSAA